jgi:nitrate reductase beta subunit
MIPKRWKAVIAGCVGVVVAVVGLVTYDTRRRQETADAQAEEARRTAELKLFLDPARAPAEIDKRLRTS